MLLAAARVITLDKDEAEDLVQTTFEIALRRLDGLREPRALRAWLLTIQAREAFRVIRRLRRLVSLDARVGEIATHGTGSRPTRRRPPGPLEPSAADPCRDCPPLPCGAHRPGDRQCLGRQREHDQEPVENRPRPATRGASRWLTCRPSLTADARLRDFLAAELRQAELDFPRLAAAAARPARRGLTVVIVAAAVALHAFVVVGSRCWSEPGSGPAGRRSARTGYRSRSTVSRSCAATRSRRACRGAPYLAGGTLVLDTSPCMSR